MKIGASRNGRWAGDPKQRCPLCGLVLENKPHASERDCRAAAHASEELVREKSRASRKVRRSGLKASWNSVQRGGLAVFSAQPSFFCILRCTRSATDSGTVLTNRLDGGVASPVNCLVTTPVYSHDGRGA
jgi:hypothetical protein